MNDKDFAVLCDLRDRLHAMEKRYPNNRRVKELHRDGWRALCKLRRAMNMTDEQFREISMPQGGGRPKTPEDED